MSRNQEYAEKYAEYAMEQQRKYGIPASVTLAQGILESCNGQSDLSLKGNNHFGIKATKGWLEDGGSYLVYKDDRPGEKFCSYASVADSYEHHSRFLKENTRYSECFRLQPDDWKGWTEGLQKAGYATGDNYAAKLQSIIERNGLDRYDRMVMEQTESEKEEQTARTERSQEVREENREEKRQDEKQDRQQDLTPEEWMRKMLSSEDAHGRSMNMGDPIVGIAVTLLTGLMALAAQIDGRDEAAKKEMMEETARTRSVDISELVPSMKKCTLIVTENGRMTVETQTSDRQFSHTLTPAETSRMSDILASDSDESVKRQKMASVFSGIVLKDYTSLSFEQGMSESQQVTMHR